MPIKAARSCICFTTPGTRSSGKRSVSVAIASPATVRPSRLHRFGISLEAGQVILAGSFIRPIDVIKGDTVVADYGEFGTVSCYFG